MLDVEVQPDTSREHRAIESANELIAFCDGVEDAGHPQLAHRGRNVARETIWLAQALLTERRLRMVMQHQRDRARDLFRDRA